MKALAVKCTEAWRLVSAIGLLRIARISHAYVVGAARTVAVLRVSAIHDALENITDFRANRVPLERTTKLSYAIRVYTTLRSELVRKSISKYSGSSLSVLYCGQTENNEKEFSFFTGCINSLPGTTPYTRDQNISYWLKERQQTTPEERTLVEMVCLCAAVVFMRFPSTEPVRTLLTDYTRKYIRFCLFVVSSRTRPPRLSVVANDHSPTQVAFSMAMRAFGIPRLYLQHASVSRYFPQLDFEYAVLRDQNSKEIYSKIGKSRGKVYVLPRSAEKGQYDELLRPLMNAESVVIYLSALYSDDSLREAIARLQTNTQVSSVYVKIHPRSMISEFKAIQDVVFTESFPTIDHVAIVPNSSVALELLRKGIRVYQLFCLDPIDTDYYGFVRRGLTIPITLDDLASTFWLSKPYLRDRVERLRSADPSQSDEWLADLKRLERDLQPIIDPQSAV